MSQGGENNMAPDASAPKHRSSTQTPQPDPAQHQTVTGPLLDVTVLRETTLQTGAVSPPNHPDLTATWAAVRHASLPHTALYTGLRSIPETAEDGLRSLHTGVRPCIPGTIRLLPGLPTLARPCISP